MRELTQLAVDGLVEAQYLVGSASTDLCRINGPASIDCTQAEELLEAAASAGYPPALALRAQKLIQTGALDDLKSRSTVLHLLEQAVHAGSPDAMTMLARALEHIDKEKYSSRANALLDNAAALGEPLILAERARALEQSARSPSDLRRAFDLFSTAYSSGTNSANAELGMFLVRNPEFRPLVDHSPFTLLANACERGIDDACIQAALARIRGCTDESCRAEAERYFALAAERGEIRAYRVYADILRKGTDVPMDKAAAAAHYKKSAELGDTGAMVNLGLMLVRGDGVERNVDDGHHWWRRAADAGSMRAEQLLEASVRSER
jgi:TPR repeat protein